MDQSPAPYIELTEQNFAETVSIGSQLTCVDFWAPWCGPCQRMNPAVHELAEDFQGRAAIAKVDVDQHPRLAAQYGVQSVPTFIIFREGQEIDRLVGAHPKARLTARLNAAIAAHTAGVT